MLEPRSSAVRGGVLSRRPEFPLVLHGGMGLRSESEPAANLRLPVLGSGVNGQSDEKFVWNAVPSHPRTDFRICATLVRAEGSTGSRSHRAWRRLNPTRGR